MITDEQIRRVQAYNAERDRIRAESKKLADQSLGAFIDEKVEKPIGKTLVEIFKEEEDDPTDPGTSLMEILSREDAEHG